MPGEEDDTMAPMERAGTGTKTRGNESLENRDELATKLDEENHHESHEVKGGSGIEVVV